MNLLVVVERWLLMKVGGPLVEDGKVGRSHIGDSWYKVVPLVGAGCCRRAFSAWRILSQLKVLLLGLG